MPNCSVEFVDIIPTQLETTISAQHETNEADHGVVCGYNRFSLIIRNDANETVGALTAYSAYAEIYVDDIWVDEDHRDQGYGRRLLDALERAYDNKGFNNINLVTNQFQAAGFYEKCGYEIEYVRHNNHHPELSKIFFIKFFDNKDQYQGILPARSDHKEHC